MTFRRKSGLSRRLVHLMNSACALAIATPALAAPRDGTVVAGSAVIETLEGGDATGVTQTSDRAIIDWGSFDLSAGEAFQFSQPGADAITLNRVLGVGPSVIDGDIFANGNVFIINADGVLFGANSTVDVNGLLATSLNIANSDFMDGDFNFQFLGNEAASVVNQGSITVADAGIVALAAPNVSNSGTIAARFGTVNLAIGDRFTIDFFGDGLVVFSPDIPSGEREGRLDVAGAIMAEGGAIYLTATDAIEFVETIINVEADLIARSATEVGGKIILTGTDSTEIFIDATLDASGADGGEIEITAPRITVSDASQLLANGLAAESRGVLWTLENAGFGGADTGTPLTGSFVYNADADRFSDINVVSGAGATLPGATYIATAPAASAGQIDFFSTTAADETNAFRLNIGLNAPLDGAGGVRTIVFGSERRCLSNACAFPGFGPDARGLIGSTSVNGTPIAPLGDQNGGSISVVASEELIFAGLASVTPGPDSGIGGAILLSSDGVLDFTGEAIIGDPPRAGALTLVGDAPVGDDDDGDDDVPDDGEAPGDDDDDDGETPDDGDDDDAPDDMDDDGADDMTDDDAPEDDATDDDATDDDAPDGDDGADDGEDADVDDDADDNDADDDDADDDNADDDSADDMTDAPTPEEEAEIEETVSTRISEVVATSNTADASGDSGTSAGSDPFNAGDDGATGAGDPFDAGDTGDEGGASEDGGSGGGSGSDEGGGDDAGGDESGQGAPGDDAGEFDAGEILNEPTGDDGQSDPQSEQERQLLCLLGVEETACAPQ